MASGQLALTELGISPKTISELSEQAAVRGMTLRNYLKKSIQSLAKKRADNNSTPYDRKL